MPRPTLFIDEIKQLIRRFILYPKKNAVYLPYLSIIAR